MIPLRPNCTVSDLPPLQLDRPAGSDVALRFHLLFLTRGLLVLAALGLPALGIHLADSAPQPTAAEAMQVAAVLPPSPVRTAATPLLRGAR
ncbi:hypothetical protein [Methylobacterium sp. J-068]|uniref:hypothetical protein n=1 Tax=Methylobacterium sp. J-068 TaxID=2836649 RepID=UPI001FB8D181|nr:hypothetical protein [Methylobacterium sp. J-068]MCJ2033064.1 hypothetical protein [Methylobacterium sp. J-068]